MPHKYPKSVFSVNETQKTYSKDWQKAEKFWAAFFHRALGRRQSGSGNKLGSPADVRYLKRVIFTFDHHALLESKYTEQKSLTINRGWLDKIDLEAAQLGRAPIFAFTIGEAQWIAVPAWAITQTQAEDTTQTRATRPFNGGEDDTRLSGDGAGRNS